MSALVRYISAGLLAVLTTGVFLFGISFVYAQPSYTMNYQGKLTNNAGLAVADGTYAIEFKLYTQSSGGAAIWTETRSGGNVVTVTNGLFSVMLGSVTSLSSVNFNQPLYLGVNVASDGEMTPRKALGTVPSAFEAKQLGGVASTSFLRSDAADSASGLLTFTGGVVSTASSSIARFNFTNATGTSLYIGGDRITDFSGTNLEVVGNSLGLSSTYLGQTSITTLGTVGTGTWQGSAISSAYLDTSVVLSSEIDASSELAAILGDETGTGNAVFSASPTFTGTAIFANTGIQVGTSVPFSDAAGTLTIQNIDALDATTETTIEAAIDTLGSLTSASSLATVGTITSGTWGGAFSNNIVTPNAIFTTGQTDEYCLTYEATGTTWEWQSCGAGYLTTANIDISSELDTIVTDNTGSGALVFGTNPTLTGNTVTLSSLTASRALFLGSASQATTTATSAFLLNSLTDETGTGVAVFATSPTLTTPNLGTPSALTLTNATGLPIGGLTGLGTGVGTALAVNIGTAGSFVVNGGALGTPSSGTLTNATGLPLTTGVTGTLTVGNGGTGATTLTGVLKGNGTSAFTAMTGGTSRITFWSDANTLSSNANFIFDGTNMVLGHTAALAIGGATPVSQTLANTVAGASETFGLFNATGSNAPGFNFYRSKNATVGSATVVASGDALGDMTWYGAQQTSTFATQNAAARISAFVDGTVTSGASADMPGRLVFYTTPDASGTLTERMRITSAGDVGIGTSTPGTNLEISRTSSGSAFRISNYGAYTAGLSGGSMDFYGRSGTSGFNTFGRIGAFKSNSSNLDGKGYLTFSTGGWLGTVDERMRITGDGYTGIGTTSPSTQLEISRTSAGSALQISNYGTATKDLSGGSIDFYGRSSNTNTSWLHTFGRIGSFRETTENNFVPGYMAFSTNDTTGTVRERMRINSSGNIGIGTTTPNQRLGIFASAADSAIEFSTVSGTAEKWTIGIDDSDAAKFKISSSSALGTSDRFVINGSGFVGIGDSTPTALFTVGSGDLFTVNSSGVISSSNNLTPNAIFSTGQADEECLTYEATGTTFEWQTCGTGLLASTDIDTSSELDTIVGDNTGSGALVFGTSPTFTTSANFGSAGVRLSDDGDGGLTFLGLGNGSDEDIKIDLDNTSNTGVFTSSTGLNQLTFSGIGLNTTAATGYSMFGTSYLYASTTNDSISLGESAGRLYNGNALYNVAVGFQAGYNATSSDNSILMGYQAGYNGTSASDNVALGYQALYTATSSSGNIAIGRSALRSLNGSGASGSGLVAIGYDALYSNTSGTLSVALGHSAFRSNTIGNRNIGIGYGAGYWSTTGSDNVFVGQESGVGVSGLTTGFNNVAIGTNALSGFTTASYNSVLGRSALGNNKTGSYNTAFGYLASTYNAAATTTVAIGAYSSYGAGVAYANQGGTTVGYQSGYSFQTGSHYNTLIGYNSGYNVTTGQYNTYLGYAGTTGGVTTGSNNILIGQDVRSGLTVTASNQLNVGNLLFGTGLGSGTTLSTGNIGIGTSTPNQKLGIFASAADSAIEFSTVSGSAEKWTVGIDDSDAAKFKISSSSALGTNDRFVINGSGFVGIGDSTPTALFTVGSGDLFTVNSSGVISSSNNLTPNAILSTGQADEECLTYEATGTTFEWQTCGSGGLTSADIDTSSELAGILTDETGTGRAVFSISPAFSGTPTFAALTATSTVTLSGTAANIALGSNFISNGGADEGISVAAGGNVTVSGTLGVTGGLTIDATTETNIEAAIDTLANLTSASSLATVGTITSGTWTAGVISSTYLDTGVLLATELDTCAEFAALGTIETGTCGSLVLSVSPTITGTLDVEAGDFSGTMTMSGTAANIALGSNYLSGDGGDEGIAIDSGGTMSITQATGNTVAAIFTDGTSAISVIPNLGTGGYNPLSVAGDLGILFRGSGSSDTASGLTIAPWDTQEMGLRMYTDGGASMTTTIMGGNVGIGDTSPASLFTVGSGDLFQINSSGQVAAGTWQGTAISSTYLDTSTILSTEIDTSAELAGILGDETGYSGGALSVFSISPVITGTADFVAGDFSSTLTFSGTAANIALGSNFLSGDGGDEGISVDASGNVGALQDQFSVCSGGACASTANGDGTITAERAIASEEGTVTGGTGITVNWDDGNQQYINLTSNTTVTTFSNATNGQTLRLVVCQDATGGRTFTFDAGLSIKWAGATTPTQTSTLNKCDVYSFLKTTAGTLGSFNQNF